MKKVGELASNGSDLAYWPDIEGDIDDEWLAAIQQISKKERIFIIQKGGPGSGHFGHVGRPGKRGGSLPGKGGTAATPEENNKKIDDMLNSYAKFGDWAVASPDERAELKKKVVADLVANSDLTEREAELMIKQWAQSSNDYDMRSLGIQEAASKEFDVELSEFQELRIEDMKWAKEDIYAGREDHVQLADGGTIGVGEVSLSPIRDVSELYNTVNDATYDKDMPRVQNAMRGMYENTQAQLRELGIGEFDQVTLYRGIALREGQYSNQKPGERMAWDANAVESWSVSLSVAEAFAGESGYYSDYSIVVSAKVNASSILSLPTSGFGCLTEGEATVLGFTKSVTVESVWDTDADMPIE